jgi:hypothetical protein
MTRGEWRAILVDAAFARRIGVDVLAFARRADGHSTLTFHV